MNELLFLIGRFIFLKRHEIPDPDKLTVAEVEVKLHETHDCQCQSTTCIISTTKYTRSAVNGNRILNIKGKGRPTSEKRNSRKFPEVFLTLR